MKVSIALVCSLAFSLMLRGADTALLFRTVSYDKIFELARKEHKPIMLYFHFNGCGACVNMERTSFRDPEVIKFFNANFVNYAVNTMKGTGIEINKIYNVQLHPTMLFLNEKGEITDKIVGAFSPADFLQHGKDALDPQKTLSWFKKQYRRGKRDADFLLDYTHKLRDGYELDSFSINEYLNTQKDEDLSMEKNVKFIYQYAIHNTRICFPYGSRAYLFMKANKELFNKFFSEDQVETRLMFIVQDHVYQAIEKRDRSEFEKALEDLKYFEKGVEYQYKEMDGRVTMWNSGKYLVLLAELHFYDAIKDEAGYQNVLQQYLSKIWNDSEALNEIAWEWYEESYDDKRLEKGLECVMRSIELKSNYNNNDTYAALLYKLGQFEKAEKQAEIAIEIAKKQNEDYTATTELLSKIKSRHNKKVDP